MLTTTGNQYQFLSHRLLLLKCLGFSMKMDLCHSHSLTTEPWLFLLSSRNTTTNYTDDWIHFVTCPELWHKVDVDCMPDFTGLTFQYRFTTDNTCIVHKNVDTSKSPLNFFWLQRNQSAAHYVPKKHTHTHPCAYSIFQSYPVAPMTLILQAKTFHIFCDTIPPSLPQTSPMSSSINKSPSVQHIYIFTSLKPVSVTFIFNTSKMPQKVLKTELQKLLKVENP